MSLGTSAAGLRRYSMFCPKKGLQTREFHSFKSHQGKLGLQPSAGSPGPLLTPQPENQTVTVRVWSFGKHLLKNGCGSVKVPGTERLAGNFPSVFCLFLRIDSL